MIYNLYCKIMDGDATADDFLSFAMSLNTFTIAGVLLTKDEALNYVKERYKKEHLEER